MFTLLYHIVALCGPQRAVPSPPVRGIVDAAVQFQPMSVESKTNGER